MIVILYFTANIALVLTAHIYGTLTDDKDMIIKGKKRWLFNIIGLLIALPLVTYMLIKLAILKTGQWYARHYLKVLNKERDILNVGIKDCEGFLNDFGEDNEVSNYKANYIKRLAKLEQYEAQANKILNKTL
jgi:hypothetical protein